jgi:hypothetical protein
MMPSKGAVIEARWRFERMSESLAMVSDCWAVATWEVAQGAGALGHLSLALETSYICQGLRFLELELGSIEAEQLGSLGNFITGLASTLSRNPS